jgi:hypothetical protein
MIGWLSKQSSWLVGAEILLATMKRSGSRPAVVILGA